MYKTRKKSVIFPFILGHSSFIINATNFYILETGLFFFKKNLMHCEFSSIVCPKSKYQT